MTLAHPFERIVEGGTVTDRIDMGERTAIACALGGPEGRTLFLLSSTDAYPQRLIGTKLSRLDAMSVDVPGPGLPGDSYYELLDAGRTRREVRRHRSGAQYLVGVHSARRPTVGAVGRALERCEQRDDTRLSRVLIDLLGRCLPRATCGCGRARTRRQADRIDQRRDAGVGPDGDPRPVARASGWRLQKLDTTEVVHAPAPPLRPLSETHSRELTKDWDRNYVHSLDWRWLTHVGRRTRGILAQADRRPGQGRNDDPVAATVRGGRRRQRDRHQARHPEVDVPEHRSGGAHPPGPEGEWIGIRAETNYGPDGIGTTLGTLFDERVPSAPFSSRCWSGRGPPADSPKQGAPPACGGIPAGL